LIKNHGKGKIPKAEWAKIADRRISGEAFASIARDYGCTAPAIRYIVGRTSSRGRAAGPHVSHKRSSLAAAPARARDEVPGQAIGGASPLVSPELSARISGDVAEFLVAVDTAMNAASPQVLARLKNAADSLMRCAARLLLEIERHAALKAS
jgi:hypothetical protein